MDLRGQERTILLKKEIDGVWGKEELPGREAGWPFQGGEFRRCFVPRALPSAQGWLRPLACEIAKRSATESRGNG